MSIKKTGYVEVMPEQLVRYNFTGIASAEFHHGAGRYWRDTLPTSAGEAQTIYTGTWNTPAAAIRSSARTNLSGDTWRTLADNLVRQNYVLDASSAALDLLQ